MRILPCRSRSCKGQPALARSRPDVPLMMGSISDPRVTYKCMRCKTTTTITSREFMALPLASIDDILSADFVLEDLNDPRAADYLRSERDDRNDRDPSA